MPFETGHSNSMLSVLIHYRDMQFAHQLLSLHSIQFAALLGDLQHKQDLYVATQDFSTTTTCFFANCEQAAWLLSFAPSLIPPGDYNNHSLGTFFEFFYYSNLTFRFAYLDSFPQLHCQC